MKISKNIINTKRKNTITSKYNIDLNKKSQTIENMNKKDFLPKFKIDLSNKEIMDDYFVITKCKLLHRPMKRRPKQIKAILKVSVNVFCTMV